MSDIINQQKNTIIKINNQKNQFYIQNKIKISLDENHNYEILKDKTLSNSILKSNANFTEPNNQKSNEKVNNALDISHFIDYFFFNEKYIKEKMPEGNNYKMKSKNYRLKNNCINLNNNKIKNIDLNNILQDIEHIQNYINNT